MIEALREATGKRVMIQTRSQQFHFGRLIEATEEHVLIEQVNAPPIEVPTWQVISWEELTINAECGMRNAE